MSVEITSQELLLSELKTIAIDKFLRITSESAVRMYKAAISEYKPISAKKAMAKYGKARLAMWRESQKLAITYTPTGQPRYNENQLEALYANEQQLITWKKEL